MFGRRAQPQANPDATRAVERVGAQTTGELRSIGKRLDSLAPRVGIPRVLLILVGLASAALIISGTREIREIVAPVFFGINLVLAASPVSSWLRRRGLPAWLCAIVSGVLVLAFLFAFFYAIYWAIASLVRELPRYTPQFESLYDQVLALLAQFGVTSTQITSQLETINPQSIVGAAGGLLSNLGSAGSLMIVLLTVIFFLVLDSMNFGQRLQLADSTHPRITEALISFAEGVRRYWVVTTIFGLIVAILDVGLLMILGVPLAFVWGVLSFITNYIPNVGFVLGLIPPALMALLDKGPIAALIVLIGYSVLNFVIQSLIQPKFTGDAVGVTPTVSFLSLLFWAYVLGPLGALLALPSTLLVKAVLIDADPRARWVNAFIASNPTTAEADSTREAFHGEDGDEESLPGGGSGISRPQRAAT
ncbi:AI-2E family transporter [Naumannella huperziae]